MCRILSPSRPTKQISYETSDEVSKYFSPSHLQYQALVPKLTVFQHFGKIYYNFIKSEITGCEEAIWQMRSYDEPDRAYDTTNKIIFVPNEDLDQPGHPDSLIRVFPVCMKKVWVLSFLKSALGRLWSDWVDAQADRSLRWVYRLFCWFYHAQPPVGTVLLYDIMTTSIILLIQELLLKRSLICLYFGTVTITTWCYVYLGTKED